MLARATGPVDDTAELRTVLHERSVLVAVRTLTDASWTLDVLGQMANDRRVQVVMSWQEPGADGGSSFAHGLSDYADGLGVVSLPWSEAERRKWDLVVAATHKAPVDRFVAPVLLLPHGPGFTKVSSVRPDGRLPEPPSRGTAAAPTVVALTAETQRHLFAPGGGVEFEVVGDTCFDQLVESLSEVDRIRQRFSIGDSQHLICMTSTWGPQSLLGRNMELIRRLLSELPAESYRFALIVHPNAWAIHGAWQLRSWLADEIAAGLMVIPPVPANEWRATVLAADCVVGDHGSVAFYAHALGRPTLLAATGEGEILDAPQVRVPHLERPGIDDLIPLRDQIETAITENPSDRPTAASLGIEHPGQSYGRLGRLVHRLLRLPVTRDWATPLLALPETRPLPVLAHTVAAAVSTRPGAMHVALVRAPTSLAATVFNEHADLHVVAPEGLAATSALSDTASIIVRDRGEAHKSAAWARSVFERHIACEVAVVLDTAKPRVYLRGAAFDLSGLEPSWWLPFASAVFVLTRSGLLERSASVVDIESDGIACRVEVGLTVKSASGHRRFRAATERKAS